MNKRLLADDHYLRIKDLPSTIAKERISNILIQLSWKPSNKFKWGDKFIISLKIKNN